MSIDMNLNPLTPIPMSVSEESELPIDVNPINVIKGISPTVDLEPVEEGVMLTVTDIEGEKEILIPKGQDGVDGVDGRDGVDGSAGRDGRDGIDGQDGVDGVDGVDGQDGTNAYVHIRYSENEPTQDSDMKADPNAWMGIYSGTASTAPAHYTDYEWYKIKGENGSGAVSAVKMNGSTISPVGGVVDIGTVITQHQDISGKANKPTTYGAGHLAAFTSDGNLSDSLYSISDLQKKLIASTSGNFVSITQGGYIADSGKKPSDFLTEHQDITGKADKVDGATNGNFAALDANGNLTDSGHKHGDYLPKMYGSSLGEIPVLSSDGGLVHSLKFIDSLADKVFGATSGNFAGLDANGNLTDSGVSAGNFGRILPVGAISTNATASRVIKTTASTRFVVFGIGSNVWCQIMVNVTDANMPKSNILAQASNNISCSEATGKLTVTTNGTGVCYLYALIFEGSVSI